MEQRERSIGLTFVNYNYAFASFYENYKNQCMAISEKTRLHDLKEIRKIISTFIYEYDYTVPEEAQRSYYHEKLTKIKEVLDADEDLLKIMNKDPGIISNKIDYHRKYYYYLLMYLTCLGEFASELTATYMPNTNIQKKLLRFSNNQQFFEKFTEHKTIILESLSEFTLNGFRGCFNNLLTFYYAYNLFINKESKLAIESLFSVILSMYLSKDNLVLIDEDNFTKTQQGQYSKNELLLHNALLYCNSKMNQSFSSYDVLPKLHNKIYVDRTLI